MSILILCKSHPYFQQLYSNWDIAFLVLPLDSNWDFWMLVVDSTWSFPNPWKNWKLGFLNIALVELLNFSRFMKGMEVGFLFIRLGRFYFQISPNSLKNWKIGIFKSPLVSYFFKLWVFQACAGEGEPIYNEIASFQVKKCSYLCNNFVSV